MHRFFIVVYCIFHKHIIGAFIIAVISCYTNSLLLSKWRSVKLLLCHRLANTCTLIRSTHFMWLYCKLSNQVMYLFHRRLCVAFELYRWQNLRYLSSIRRLFDAPSRSRSNFLFRPPSWMTSLPFPEAEIAPAPWWGIKKLSQYWINILVDHHLI